MKKKIPLFRRQRNSKAPIVLSAGDVESGNGADRSKLPADKDLRNLLVRQTPSR